MQGVTAVTGVVVLAQQAMPELVWYLLVLTWCAQGIFLSSRYVQKNGGPVSDGAPLAGSGSGMGEEFSCKIATNTDS